MKMIQVDFECKVGISVRHTTAWVDASWRLRPGQSVTFEHEDVLQKQRRWIVVRVGTIVQDYAAVNQKWRVGGL